MWFATLTNATRRASELRLGRAILVLLALLFLPACYPVSGERAYCDLSRADPALPDERSKDVPMMRIGSLPHPFGPIPVSYGDHDDLGTHSIRDSPFRAVRLGEQSGGIIYTQRVGFIDLAHTRNTADLTWNCYQRIRPALAESRPRVLLAGAEPSLFLVHLDYPPGWDTLDPETRERLIDHLAVQLAVRMGYVISTWHEVLTTFGFHGVVGIPEEQSAFAYDDQPSHLVGAVAAGEAIRRVQSSDTTYNEAMTAALAELLIEYGALDAAGTRRAVAAAKGVWWGLDGPSVRQVHLGMANEPFTPILLPPQAEGALAPVPIAPPETPEPENPTSTPAPTPAPFTWQVPTLAPPPGMFPTEPDSTADRADTPQPLVPTVRIDIDPRTRFADELFALFDHEGPWLDLDQDGPALKAHLENHFNPAP